MAVGGGKIEKEKWYFTDSESYLGMRNSIIIYRP